MSRCSCQTLHTLALAVSAVTNCVTFKKRQYCPSRINIKRWEQIYLHIIGAFKKTNGSANFKEYPLLNKYVIDS